MGLDSVIYCGLMDDRVVRYVRGKNNAKSEAVGNLDV